MGESEVSSMWVPCREELLPDEAKHERLLCDVVEHELMLCCAPYVWRLMMVQPPYDAGGGYGLNACGRASQRSLRLCSRLTELLN